MLDAQLFPPSSVVVCRSVPELHDRLTPIPTAPNRRDTRERHEPRERVLVDVLDLLDVQAVARQQAAERFCGVHVLEFLRGHERQHSILGEQRQCLLEEEEVQVEPTVRSAERCPVPALFVLVETFDRDVGRIPDDVLERPPLAHLVCEEIAFLELDVLKVSLAGCGEVFGVRFHPQTTRELPPFLQAYLLDRCGKWGSPAPGIQNPIGAGRRVVAKQPPNHLLG